MKHYIVTAGIIINDKQILCLQRAKSKYDYISYKYEFPGGKVEEEESFVEALSRELREELDIHVDVREKDFLMTVEHEYKDFRITMHCYLCYVDSRDFTLKEHVDFVWLDKSELLVLDWAAADLPIVGKLMEKL